ncbi:hypothetical protein AND_007238 [Anopheles darlingi]|uniref:DALR anticodon binding domain-containing protein n=1 Tax=Anopheles darlingi TaxID=43151 RepID=W5J9G9_ANODA|nr:hypothetical protein AND_007238 [Anopheles darlingi]
MDLLAELHRDLTNFLSTSGYTTGYTLKFLDRRLCQMGDVMIRHGIDSELRLDVERLLLESKEWKLPIERAILEGNTGRLWIQRATAFQWGLESYRQRPMFGVGRGRIFIEDEPPTDDQQRDTNGQPNTLSMANFRMNALRKVLRNCFTYTGYQLVSERDPEDNRDHDSRNLIEIAIVHRKTRGGPEQLGGARRIEMLVGPVLHGADLGNADDYIARRSNDMQLIAQHKYRVDLRHMPDSHSSIASLGRSAAIVDVLQAKHSSAIDMRRGLASSTISSCKGASFILYNYARLAALFEKYETMRQTQGYPELPSTVEGLDFTLLTEPDEWQLLFVYVIGFPTALRQTLGDGMLERMAPHRLLEFTFGLVSCLSKYYRQTRILTENRPKLVPAMLVRLCLLRSVYHTLDVLLNLLNLEAVTKM